MKPPHFLHPGKPPAQQPVWTPPTRPGPLNVGDCPDDSCYICGVKDGVRELLVQRSNVTLPLRMCTPCAGVVVEFILANWPGVDGA